MLPCPPPKPPAPPQKPSRQTPPAGYNPYTYDPYRPLYGGPYGQPLQKASPSSSNPCAPDQVWDTNKNICRAPIEDLGCCPPNLPPGLNCPVIWPPCGSDPGTGGACCPPGVTCPQSIPPCPGNPPPPGGGGGGNCCTPEEGTVCPPGVPICPNEPPVCLGCCAQNPIPEGCDDCPPGCPSGGPPPPPPPPPGACPGVPCPPGCNCDVQSGVCDCSGPQGEGTIFDSQGGFAPPGAEGKGELWPNFSAQPQNEAKGELWPDLADPNAGQPPPGPPQQEGQAQPAPSTPVGNEVNYTRIPSAEEIAQLPMGSRVTTPWGEVQPDENGEPRLIMNEQGKAAYLEAHARAKRAYGPSPFAAFQGAPEPEIVVGGRNFNPFTGMWS